MKAGMMLKLCDTAKTELERRQGYVRIILNRRRTMGDSEFRDEIGGMSAHIGVMELAKDPDEDWPDKMAMVPLVAIFHEVCGHGAQRALQFNDPSPLSRVLAANSYACRGSNRYYGISSDGCLTDAYFQQPYEIAAQYAAIRETKDFLDRRMPDDAERLLLGYVKYRQMSLGEFLPDKKKEYKSVKQVLTDMNKHFRRCAHAHREYSPEVVDDDALVRYFKPDKRVEHMKYVSACTDGHLQDRMMAAAYRHACATVNERHEMDQLAAVQKLRIDGVSAFTDRPRPVVKDPPSAFLRLQALLTFDEADDKSETRDSPEPGG